MNAKVLIRGGGDLASGVAARLHRAGMQVLITELAQPLVIRRSVAFAEAVFTGETKVEEITARLGTSFTEVVDILENGEIAVFVDPDLNVLGEYAPLVLIDARMTKKPPEIGMDAAPLVVGLGPGFCAGENCHAVIETMRGHTLGRVIWEGTAVKNTGVPGAIGSKTRERVLRAPTDGILKGRALIGEKLKKGDLVAEVEGIGIPSPFDGVLRGLLYPGLSVAAGMKVGDVDPRGDPKYCVTISDKSLAIGGGVLEAVFSRQEIREKLF